jgi:hypothetical protein
MTDQENKDNSFFSKALEAVLKVAKKNNLNPLDFSSDNFKNNFKEILNNPNSKYAEHVCLFNEIPKLKEEEKKLNDQIINLQNQVNQLNLTKNNNEATNAGLKALVEELEEKKSDLENQINGYCDQGDGEDKEGLEDVVVKLTKQRDDLSKQINGDEKKSGLSAEVKNLKSERDALKKEIDGDGTSEDNLVKDGLLEYRDTLYNQIHGKDGLENKRSILNNQINHLIKKNSIVEKLSELKSEAIKNQEFYQNCVIRMIGLILFSSWLAYIYGDGIIDDITKIINKDSRDYFGMFLMKIPFSLMIITFISGGFIFINKLLVIIERINNQLRNISQISVIASQIDKKAFDLNHKKTEEELKNAVEKKEESALFYNLIADYLINLSKNELELKEKKGSQLKMLKELSGIINKINPKP